MRDRESIGGLLKNRREKKWDKKQRVNKTREGEEEGKREREREKKKKAERRRLLPTRWYTGKREQIGREEYLFSIISMSRFSMYIS